MTRKYAKAVEQITLSKDAKSRILKNISEADLHSDAPAEPKTVIHWKPVVLAAAACAALLVVINIPRPGSVSSAAAAADEEKMMSVENADTAGEGKVESYNGTSAYDAQPGGQYHYASLKELEADAGYEVKEPVLSFSPSSITYELYGRQAYIIYQSDQETVTLTAGSNALADYEWTYTKEAEGTVLEGYEDEKWSAVKYQLEGVYYELTVSNPVDEKTILSMIPKGN